MSPVSASASVPVMERPPMAPQGPMPPMEAYEPVVPPVIETPDQAAGTAGVYRSRNVAEEPTPQFEVQDTDVAQERVKATARPLGNLAMAGVAVVAESSYAEEYRNQRGMLVLQQQAQQQAMAALRPQEEQSRFVPSMVDTKKDKKGLKATIKAKSTDALGDDDPFKYLRRAAKTVPRVENGRNLN